MRAASNGGRFVFGAAENSVSISFFNVFFFTYISSRNSREKQERLTLTKKRLITEILFDIIEATFARRYAMTGREISNFPNVVTFPNVRSSFAKESSAKSGYAALGRIDATI